MSANPSVLLRYGRGIELAVDALIRPAVRIDVEAATLDVVADGFEHPTAANFDSRGTLYVTDSPGGELVRVDVETGAREVIARVEPGIDNLAIDSADRIYLTIVTNSIYEVSPDTHDVRVVLRADRRVSCHRAKQRRYLARHARCPGHGDRPGRARHEDHPWARRRLEPRRCDRVRDRRQVAHPQ